ncbi:putative capsid protein [Dragonfly larvae associated circular virus-4]|uniref:Putative capsid protein n=1 Tax=Dragonfly larvae associated circular virus-4 TaxID=1454025 RepID=W5U2Q0_9VIRU|nr:putative capsid protein [Dragonfly larvae associated circular virus-4]AHH31469.1 putative capsid protein [Dragonfly larvae associated circular virus-4]
MYGKRKYAKYASAFAFRRNMRTRRRYGAPGDPSMTSIGNISPTGRSIARANRSNIGRTLTGTTRSRYNSGQGVTQQHDVRLIYAKKRMPNYKKKPWRRFVKKVHAVSEKDLGSRTALFSNTITYNNTVDGADECLTIGLYPLQSTDPWLNDLNTITSLENQGNPTAAAGGTVDPTTKFIFQSGVLDLTIRNATTQTGQLNPDQFNAAATQEIDIYEIMCRADFMQVSGGNKINLSQCFEEGSVITRNIANAPGDIKIANRGATPFDLPAALSRYGMKIIKKTKYFVPGGGTITYQIRDPKRRVSSFRDLNVEGGVNKVGWTKYLYINAKVIPGFLLGTGPASFVQRMQVGVTRKYMYKVEGFNESRDSYSTLNSTISAPA